MDLAKIIGELKMELQYVDAAIASMEELARVQSLADAAARHLLNTEPQPPIEDVPPVKRGRGRPRKNPAPTVSTGTDDSSSEFEEQEVQEAESAEDSTASAA